MALVVACSLAGACNQRLRPRVQPAKFTHQSEAGTGHVAVLSVAPWAELVDDLQPKFSLTSDQAFVRAGATTAATERKLLDMLRVVARIATPSTSTNITRTSKSGTSLAADGTVTSTAESSRDATESLAPGEAPEFDPSLPGDLAASKLPGIETVLGKKPEILTGAHTQYLLANALYQEVQLLNRYLEFAAMRHGYDPYVARLQVSLMPSVRNAPYDAYTTLGFFPTDAVAGRAPVNRGVHSRQLPVVIPLLVTDDMEAALASDSADVVRQYALALSAMIQGFALRGEVERYTDELVTTVTKDFNSVYQVARLGESSVRVRMGARLHSSGNYFMVPQTHNVTVLVLAPREWGPEAEIAVEAKTEFRHVDTGEPLSPRSRDATVPAMRDVLDLFGMDGGSVDAEDIDRLRLAGASNDFPTFRECALSLWHRRTSAASACATCPPRSATDSGYEEQTVRRLWIALAGIAVGGQYTSTSLKLPQVCPCALPPGLQSKSSPESAGRTPATPGGAEGAPPSRPAVSAYATDDGMTSLLVELRPVRGVKDARIGARLLVGTLGTGGSLADPTLAVPAEEVRLVRAGNVLRCRFPSLARTRCPDTGVTAQKLVEGGQRVRLEIDSESLGCEECRACGETAPVQYEVRLVAIAKEPPTDDPLIKIAALPAIRACGCDGQDIDVRVERTARTPSGAVRVRLRFRFLAADGKTAASGIVVGEKLNEKDVDLDSAEQEKTIPVKLSQLADGSTLEISAPKLSHGTSFGSVLTSSPGASAAGRATVLIAVTAPKCGAEEPAESGGK
ncbi:MAG: hypothetical protein IT460_07325 [Planctomycetes bacterium]|nr:hypothetical protein [Planctomycetota bacterium]